jgi:predicted phosphodiesterase
VSRKAAAAPPFDLLQAIDSLGITPLPQPIELTGDYMIVGDVHVPYTDWALARRVAQVARAEGIARLIVAGDFWNYDSYSHYPPMVAPPSWQTERKSGKLLAREWAQTFEEIIFTMGNHERRKQKLTAGEEDDTDIFAPLASVANIRSNPLGWCIVHSGGVTWRVTHPKNYSINQLTVADTLAQKFDCNVISFHEHFLAQGFSRYGQHVIVNGGCLVDPGKLAYVNLDDSKGAGMKRGFVSLRGGYVQLYGDRITDWSRYESSRSAGRTRRRAGAA